MDRRPQINLQADIVVVGGGVAGVAAATTAAQKGLSVILIERYGFCGGGAVAGLSGTICGLYEATEKPDARPNQVVFGFADKFAKRLSDMGGLADPVRYGKTFTRVHDPLMWRETADGFLEENNVQVLFHTTVTGVLIEGDERVEGVTACSKQGPMEIRAGLTIDASGDADIVAMAGWSSFVGRGDGLVQNPTMIFRLLGIDVEKFRATYGDDTIMPHSVSEAIQSAEGYNLPRKKIWLFPTPRPGELMCNCTRIVGRDGRELNTLIARDFTDAEVEGRKQAREYARFFRDHLAGCENAFVNDTGVQVGVRQTRQALGQYILKNDDVVSGRKFTDGIARSPWPIELHTGERPRVEWLLDDVYEIPLGCFIPQKGEGLLLAGRCLSAEHEAMASARVTAQCFSYGHAAGFAAVLALRDGQSVQALNGADIRTLLNEDGARLD